MRGAGLGLSWEGGWAGLAVQGLSHGQVLVGQGQKAQRMSNERLGGPGLSWPGAGLHRQRMK